MVLKKYLFLFLCFCFFSNLGNAQHTPGYLGKKGFIEYDFVAPFFIYLGPKTANLTHSFRMNYIVKRRVQIGLSYDTYKIKDYLIFSNRVDQLKGNAIGVNVDFYLKNNIAPIGTYIRAEAKQIFGTFQEESFKSPYLGIGYGIKYVFFDKMLFNIGGTIGYPFKFPTETDSGFQFNNDFKSYVGRHYLYRIHIGVGVFLF